VEHTTSRPTTRRTSRSRSVTTAAVAGLLLAVATSAQPATATIHHQGGGAPTSVRVTEGTHDVAGCR
jgi:hypothetical protein